MTPREIGFLLLSSTLGDSARKVFTDAQMRTLARRVGTLKVDDPDRELSCADLASIGYSQEEARKILLLLSQQDMLQWYLNKAKKNGCYPITRVSPQYPQKLRSRLGLDCPGCLWAKGDIRLLQMPMIGLVGSRDLQDDNAQFARQVGIQAAKQGYVLVSGNARGADRAAQDACLENGGFVVCVVADCIPGQTENDRILYLSEGGFDLAFTPQRALHRNKVVHSLADKMLVAQCALETGGTWSGTVTNLRGHYSPVFCYQDHSEAVRRLVDMGATAVGMSDLQDLSGLQGDFSFFAK